MKFVYKIFDASLPRLGPGDEDSTLKALRSLGLVSEEGRESSQADGMKILDLGCGNGSQTLVLAKNLNGTILAVDNHQPYLDELQRRAEEAGMAGRITTMLGDMADTGLEPESFDLIWSEGALYNMGFEHGLSVCRSLLRPGGLLGASELVWFQPSPPSECRDYFDAMYPPMSEVDVNLAKIKECGLDAVDHFPLPKSAWLDSFYLPLEELVDRLEAEHVGDPAWQEMLNETRKEIIMYRNYSDYYGYEFFMMRRV